MHEFILPPKELSHFVKRIYEIDIPKPSTFEENRVIRMGMGTITIVLKGNPRTKGIKRYSKVSKICFGRAGFKPIGDFNTGFTGSYDGGGGGMITGLTMDRIQSNIYGLFGIVSSGGQISNVGLTNIDITTNNTVGGLAGINQGTITDSYVSGTITSSTNGTTGGLVGENNRTIRRSYSLANVNGRANVGGLVGTNYFGTITDSYATGNVDASLTIAGDYPTLRSNQK